MTNRHPLHCQTLLLNEIYLNDHYPNWKQWLSKFKSDKECLKKLAYYTKNLETLKNKQNNPIIETCEKNLRSLHFIMDTSQKKDPFKLNKIWSVYHKNQQIKNGK